MYEYILYNINSQVKKYSNKSIHVEIKLCYTKHMKKNIIELIRKEQKLSIESLAKQSNMSYSTVYRILTNKIEKPKISDLQKLCNTLNINSESIMIEYNYLERNNKSTFHSTPVIIWDNLIKHIPFEKNKVVPVINTENTILTDKPYCFATELTTSKYKPYFYKKTIIVADTTNEPSHLNYMIYIDHDELPSIGQWKKINNKTFIHSLDPTIDKAIFQITKKDPLLYYKICEIHYQ